MTVLRASGKSVKAPRPPPDQRRTGQPPLATHRPAAWRNPPSADQFARAPYITQVLAEPYYVPFPEVTVTSQRRVFRAFLPGLAAAEFVRLGQIHRNTFLEAPRVLAPDLSARERPHLFFAGQITGVEGYVE